MSSPKQGEQPQVLSVEDDIRGDGVSSLDYMISLMGYAIGIGNLWRFPYLVGRWGGGSFVLAYLICLVLVASPMYFLELTWGQSTRRSTMNCFRTMHPRWVGIGWTSCVMITYVLTYYNMLLSYSCVYLVNSFYDPLPWTNEANPPDTLPKDTSASQNFWWHTVLNRFDPELLMNDEVTSPGGLQWPLVAGLLTVWVIVFLALFKGMEASAKVSYVTVGLPVLLLAIMLVRSLSLDGAADGIEFYIGKFDTDMLVKGDMWAAACGQILFSLSPGMGTAITLSSYTRKNEDVYKVNLLVTVCNSCFSIIGGFAVFSILGFMSKKSCTDPSLVCKPVSDLASSGGAGLAFVTLAEGVSQFGEESNLFSVFFFIMLLTLGLDSTFAWGETVIAYIEDLLIEKGRPVRREYVTAGCCTAFFLLGLPFCTRIGFNLLDVVDHYAASYVLICTCFLESIILRIDWSWEKITSSIARATKGKPGFPEGRRVPFYWKFTLYYTVPAICFVLFWYLFITDLVESYEGYPPFLQTIGWVVLVTTISPTFIFFFINRNATPLPLPEGFFEGQEPLLKERDERALPPPNDAPAAGPYAPPHLQDLNSTVGSAVHEPAKAHVSKFFEPPAAEKPETGRANLNDLNASHPHVSLYFNDTAASFASTNGRSSGHHPLRNSLSPPKVPNFPDPPFSSHQGFTSSIVCPLMSVRRPDEPAAV